MEGYEDRAHKQIQIESWSNSARTLNLRGSTPGGPFAESHVTNADRSRATDTYEIHGIPTKLQVNPQTAPVRRGECYVRVTLLLDGEPVQRLSAGYLTDSKTISWPPGVHEGFLEGPGLIRTITGTNPAAGAAISETVPTNAAWKFKSLRVSLATDGNVANREAFLYYDDGSVTIYRSAHGPAHVANSTYYYHFIAGYPIEETGFDAGGQNRLPMPGDLLLSGGYRIQSGISSGQATDDWGAPVLQVEEWINE